MAAERQGQTDVQTDVAVATPEPAAVPGALPALGPGRGTLGGLARLPADARGASVAALQRGYGNAVLSRAILARKPPTVPGAPAGAAKGADANELLDGSHPHLKSVMTPGQIGDLQELLDARAELERLGKEIEPLRNSILSEDVDKREALQLKINAQDDIVRKHALFSLPTEKVLGGDILPKPDDKSVSPQEAAFREQLWKQLVALPILAIVGPGTRPQPLFTYKWGEGSWSLNHDKGVITFKHLLQIEKWNLDYQQALLKRDLEVTTNMEKRLRDLGGQHLDLNGKKVGELWGYVWNTNVKVAEEVGKPTGYVDDSQGRTEMYATFYGAKGARAIVKAPDGWLHVYKLDENLNTLTDLKPLVHGDDGYSYMLNSGAAVVPEMIVTSNGVELEKAAQGWRAKTDPNQIGTIEQFAIGAIFGDFWEDPNAPAIVGQIFIGVIPIVGQIADARDVIAGVIKIYETGGKDGKFQTAMALVGFIPLFGDAIKSAKSGGKKAAVEAAKEAAPATTKALAKEVLQDASKVAKTFGVEEVRKAFPNLGEQVAKALGEGGAEAAEELAKSVKTAMEQFGGNAGHVVAASGGKWKDLAKALGKAPGGAAVGAEMQAWRKSQIAAMKNSVEEGVSDIGSEVGRQLEPPRFQQTGTDSFMSDVDISFLGKDSTVYHNAAKRRLAEVFGIPYEDVRKLLDLDIFTDPARLLEWTKIEGKAGKNVEKALLKEAELNTFAKALREGGDPAKIKQMAKELGVDAAALDARVAELSDLAANPAKRAELELQMDVLHNKLTKETTAEGQAAIAQQMAEIQGKLNASVKGAYATPGGVMVNVALRDNVDKAREIFKTTPALRYMAVLDDNAMLQPVLAKASKGFDAEIAKDMSKYADRTLVRAGQLGAADMGSGAARSLFDDVSTMLGGARKNPADLAKATSQLGEARDGLVKQLDGMLGEAKKLSEADPAAAGAAGSDAVAMIQAQQSALRGTAIALRKADEAGNPPADE